MPVVVVIVVGVVVGVRRESIVVTTQTAPMRALAIVHQPDAGPGVFAGRIAARGIDLDSWLVPEQPEPPADPGGYDAAMVFGGAMNVSDEDAHPWLRREGLGRAGDR